MIRSFRSLSCALLWVLAACGGSRCDGRTASPPAKTEPAKQIAVAIPKPDLRLVLLTDPRGYLEPCGCNQRPLGGVDKLATVVGQAKRDHVPLLVLAAGDFAMGTELRPEDAAEARAQEEMRAETFVDAYKQIGVAAIVPGALDLMLPAERRAKLIARGGFPWLLEGAGSSDGAPLPFSLGRVIELAGVKVGVMGLVAPDPAHPLPGLTLPDELGAIAASKSAELRAQGAQLVIALVTGDRRAARQVAGKGPDIVLMGGLDLERALPPTVVGDAVLLHAGRQGQNAVTLDLGLKPAAADKAWEDASAWSRREAQRELDRQISELRARISAWTSDPKLAKADIETQRRRLGELEGERERAAQPTFAGRWFHAELVELAPEVPDDPALAQQLEAHDVRVNEHNRVSLADRKPTPAPPGTPAYAGSQACSSCHQQAFAWWRGTKHGRAYATLERVHKEYNLNCVSCHVTGYNEKGGSTVTHVEGLKDVGCESCHGPGSLHVAQPEAPSLIARAVPESVCASCHTKEHSDRFVYESFRQMLIVPGHGKPADRQ
jgi:hypothetical protein